MISISVKQLKVLARISGLQWTNYLILNYVYRKDYERGEVY